MPYNGSGVYNLPAPEYPAVPGTTITAEARNTIDADIQSALRIAATRDGQATITGNWNWGGFGITGINALGAAVGTLTASGTWNFTGTVTGTTQPPGTNNTTYATTAFVQAVAFSSALPAQAGNAGKLVTTDGSVASWTDTVTIAFTFSGQLTVGNRMNEAKGADIVSAATVDLAAATGNLVHITGTTTITAFTIPSGAERTLVFDGILTLTHGANLILPTAANIVTAAGDSCKVRGDGAAARVVSYERANGRALAAITAGMLKVFGPTTPAVANTFDFLTTFSANAANFRNYRIILDGIKPSADDTLLWRAANAGVVDTGSKYYDSTQFSSDTTSATSGTVTGATIASAHTLTLTIDVLNVNDTANAKIIQITATFVSGTSRTSTVVSSFYESANAMSGMRLFWSSGATNFTAVGSVTIWGYNDA